MRKRIESIANFFGKTHQMRKLVEELAELIVAIQKFDYENIKEEIVDVEIMIEQVKYLLDIDKKDLEHIRKNKLFRTCEVIKNNKVDY